MRIIHWKESSLNLMSCLITLFEKRWLMKPYSNIWSLSKHTFHPNKVNFIALDKCLWLFYSSMSTWQLLRKRKKNQEIRKEKKQLQNRKQKKSFTMNQISKQLKKFFYSHFKCCKTSQTNFTKSKSNWFLFSIWIQFLLIPFPGKIQF